MSETELVVGIDLGTTNSEIAAFLGGQVRVLGPEPKMLPSCVGITPAGELLVGQEARHQQILYPERTVRRRPSLPRERDPEVRRIGATEQHVAAIDEDVGGTVDGAERIQPRVDAQVDRRRLHVHLANITRETGGRLVSHPDIL